jgi:hypothetical protein
MMKWLFYENIIFNILVFVLVILQNTMIYYTFKDSLDEWLVWELRQNPQHGHSAGMLQIFQAGGELLKVQVAPVNMKIDTPASLERRFHSFALT